MPKTPRRLEEPDANNQFHGIERLVWPAVGQHIETQVWYVGSYRPSESVPPLRFVLTAAAFQRDAARPRSA